MPDLSLIKPLCDELNIRVNDLLCGEIVDKKDYKYKLEENILNTINYSNKIKKTNNIFKIILGIILLLMISLIIIFFIDVRRMNQNKPVIFSTWGIDYAPTIQIEEGKIYKTIKEYITNINDKEVKDIDNAKSFVSMKVYLIEELKNKKYNVYAWVNESTYYQENNEIIEYSSSSIPYKFIVAKEDNYQVIDSRTPRDGYYEEDMKNTFPKSVIKDMDKIYYDGTNEILNIDIEEQVKLYFHK